MFRYLVRRLIWAAVLFLVVTVVTYVIFFIIPANPAAAMAGKAASAQKVKEAEAYLGLDKPVYIQYLRYLGRLAPVSFNGGFHFKDPSLGRSFANRQEVNEIVLDAAPVTASLVFGGVVVWMMIAIPIGILSALRPKSLMDRVTMVAVLIGISAHPVWIGLILAYFVGFKLGWTPITGYCDFINPSTDCGGPVAWAHSLILPWITFAILFAALYVRMIRANVMEALTEEYVRTARAKGAPESVVMRGHVLRNAMLPVVTMLGMDIGIALGGAIFTETVFSLPGLGQTALQAVTNFDLPVVMGITVFATLCIIIFNLIVDLLYAWIDPRIRLN